MATITNEKRSAPSNTRRKKQQSPQTAKSRTPTQDQIAQRAYQIWQARGQTHGQDREDWLKAEEQLRSEHDRF
jgi:hypothetical protein